MNERNRKKYMIYATIALTCVVVDAIFVFALGGVVKWIAGLASPFVWAGLLAVAVITARLVRFLGRTPLVRQQGPQAYGR